MMKLVLLTLFAAVYYGAWSLYQHHQEVWAVVVFVPCTFVVFPLLWALFSNGLTAPVEMTPAVQVASPEAAYDDVIADTTEKADTGAAPTDAQAFPDIADNEAATPDSPEQPTPPQASSADDPHPRQASLF
ncbi:hypothetical protein [Noviherbaspirillum pedocola]|uniref:Uncharacterized protein n=1 Tax=Noviherbaspirillum pedocola TaxID=2801341 RepID=A0A934W8S3_9BURK|nr:hypothetical protein [Noviherbaspirillum pedocola]MBK4737920.1 hypothetical protein [Noviherbaspirillum pedocola]